VISQFFETTLNVLSNDAFIFNYKNVYGHDFWLLRLSQAM